MMVLCLGILLVGLGRTVTAADYAVSASYLGPPPARAATIDNPLDGAKFTTKPITVSGSCPNNSYVTLLRNGFASGSALCAADSTYTLRTDLFEGTNALQAQVYSQTDVAGPLSGTVHVVYTAPVTASLPAGTTGLATPTNSNSGPVSRSAPTTPAEPLLLKTDFLYQGHYPGRPVNYHFSVEGGQAPYAISINWGDGSQKLITVSSSGAFTVVHTYDKAGGYRGSYIVTVAAADTEGSQTMLQILAIINNRPSLPAGGGTEENGASGGQDIQGALRLIWPVYGLLVLMLASFWFGERRELHILRHKPGRPRHV